MSYSSAIDQLTAITPELFTQPGAPRRKFSLDEIGILLNALGNPHRRFPAVLIAGTNGKGSTAATLASILAASGLRTGLYTSPHLTRPNERIRINGLEISDDDFARLYFRVHDAGQQLVLDRKLDQLPSFFETLTTMAFLHFAEAAPKSPHGPGPVDFAVLEVGMGGRLDATNIVNPLLSVITDISLDHTEWLGSTIAAIAREKAGILRPNGTLVTLPQHPEANQALGEAAIELNVRGVSAVPYMPSIHTSGHEPASIRTTIGAPFIARSLRDEWESKPPSPPQQSPASGHEQAGFNRTENASGSSREPVGRGFSPGNPAAKREGALAPASYTLEVLGQSIEIDSPLHGAHQHRNIALAIAAAVELAEHHNIPITPASIAEGIRTTKWPARLERITTHDSATGRATDYILDVAHNPAGAWALRAGLRDTLAAPGPHVLVFSCLRDKPLREMAQILFPLFDRVVFAPIASPRATPAAELLAAAAATGTPAEAASSIAEALSLARHYAQPHEASARPAAAVSLGHERVGRGFSPDNTSTLKEEGALAPEATVIVSGSVYLVGEARALLLAQSEAKP